MVRPAPLLALSSFVLLAGLLAGCSRDIRHGYPSLLPRTIESRSDDEPVVAEAPQGADPAIDVKIATLDTTLAAIRKALVPVARRAEVAATAARGAAAGSEPWITAQSALAELDDYHAQTLGVVADYEELAALRAAELKPGYPALEASHDAAEAALTEQSVRIARLQAALPGA